MFHPINPEQATGATKEALTEAQSQFGAAINLFKVAANAPNVLQGVLAFNKELTKSCELSPRQIELVAMLTSALNHCDYCVNVHMQVGKIHGLTEAALLEAMAGNADNEQDQTLLNYTNEFIRNRGRVPKQQLDAMISQGFSKKVLLEVIGVVGIYTSLQYIRHVANPEHDFPQVEAFDAALFGA